MIYLLRHHNNIALYDTNTFRFSYWFRNKEDVLENFMSSNIIISPILKELMTNEKENCYFSFEEFANNIEDLKQRYPELLL